MLMPWGECKGIEVCDLPSDYLEWLVENVDVQISDLNRALLFEVEAELGFRANGEARV